MKKLMAVCAVLLMGSFLTATAATQSKNLIKSRLVQATQNTTFDYQGNTIFVPKGQTVIVGQRENGSLVLRGLNFQRLKINDSVISTQGYSIISYQPTSQVVFLNRGEQMTVTDAHGVTSSVAERGAISTVNAKVTSDNVAELKAAAEQEALAAEAELTAMPTFVSETATTSTANEQAVQDVEETLSPSAPR